MSIYDKWIATLVGEPFAATLLEMGLLTDGGNDELVEISSAGYQRYDLSESIGVVNGTLTNTIEIRFEQAEEDWPEIHGFGLYFNEVLAPIRTARIAPVVVNQGETIEIGVGAFEAFFGDDFVDTRLNVDDYNFQDFVQFYQTDRNWKDDDLEPATDLSMEMDYPDPNWDFANN